MIYEILWSIIIFFCTLGYFIMWLQHRSRVSRAVPKKYVNHHNPDQSSHPPLNISMPEISSTDIHFSSISNIEEFVSEIKTEEMDGDTTLKEEIIDLDEIIDNDSDDQMIKNDDDKDTKTKNNEDTKDDKVFDLVEGEVLDLDEDDETDNVDSTTSNTVISNPDNILSTNLTSMDSDIDNFIKQAKSHKNHNYTLVTNIKCPEKNSKFLKGLENSSVRIVDSDDKDYWSVVTEDTKDVISIVPSCCVNVPGSGRDIEHTKKRLNTKASFREEILKIKNKNQESMIKRKYVLLDMIECEKEHCAALKLVLDILKTFQDGHNDNFGETILTSVNKLAVILKQIFNFHNEKLQIKLSESILNPGGVADIFLLYKSDLQIYSKFFDELSTLKDLLKVTEEKSIKCVNSETKEISKLSKSAFVEMLKTIEYKLSQYCDYLLDLMRYTGRVTDGAIYELQKSMTMFERIPRKSQDEELLKQLDLSSEEIMNIQRIVRITDTIMITDLKFISRTPEKSPRTNERVRLLLLTKTSLLILNRNNDKDTSKFTLESNLKLSTLKLYRRADVTGDNEACVWNMENPEKWTILLMYFQTKYNRMMWEYELERRIKKNGNSNIFVKEPDDLDLQYKQHLSTEKLQVAQENQIVTFESVGIEDHNGNQKMDESGTSSSDIMFESAQMDTPESLTSTSYKTAPESRTNEKATRPVSGISQDSFSTLDGVRTPFSDEESLASGSVNVFSELKEMSITEDDDLVWDVQIQNFDSTKYEIIWILSGKQQHSTNYTMNITKNPDLLTTYNCKFIRKNPSKIESGQLICKIIDKINGVLQTSCALHVLISGSKTPSIEVVPCIIELKSINDDITVKDSDKIELIFDIIQKSGSCTEEMFQNLHFYKDNNKIDIDNKRTFLNIDIKSNKLTLSIEKANTKDAGMYNIKQDTNNNKSLNIINCDQISILVLVEKPKKAILRTASQEENELYVSEDNNIGRISPMKEAEQPLGSSDGDELKDAVSTKTALSDLARPILALPDGQLKNVIIKEGDHLILKVKVTGGKDVESNIIWNYNKNNIKSNTKNGLSKISIEDCKMEHGGNYICSIKGINDEKIDFNVTIEPVSKLECEIEELDLIAGETIDINMIIKNIPEDIVKKHGKWLLNNKDLNMHEYNGLCDIKNGKINLKLIDVDKKLNGVLSFNIAASKSFDGYKSSEIKVNIRGEKKIVSKPSISALKTEIIAKEGENVILSVQKNTEFNEKIIWTFNNKMLTTKKDTEYIIEKCNKINEGLYIIKIDGFNESIININLKINSDLTVKKKENSKIECDIEELDLIEGENLELILKTINISQIILKGVKWKLNSKPFKPELKKGKTEIFKNGDIKLFIPKITSSVAGKLICVVDEKQNLLSTEIVIKVRKKSDNENKLILTAENADIHKMEGEQLILKVLSNNELSSNIIWLYNNKEINDNDNIKILTKSKESSITFFKCTMDNSGNYICKTKDDSTSVNINVKISKGQITSLIDCNIEEIDLKVGEDLNLIFNTTNISIDSLKNGKWLLNNNNIQLDKFDAKINISENKIHLFIPNVDQSIKGFIKFVIDEKKNIQSPEIEIKIRGEKDSKGKKEIEKSKDEKLPQDNKEKKEPTDPKEKIIKDSKDIEKPKDSKDKKEPIDSKEKITKDSKSTIKLTTKNTTVRTEVNKDINIIVDSNIELNTPLKWSFNGKQLKENDNIKITESKNKLQSILLLKKCQKNQEGIYKCYVKTEKDGIEINLIVSIAQKTGFLDCDIEEIDLEEGESLELYLNASDIDLNTLKEGKWILNEQELNLNDLKADSSIDEYGIELFIKKVDRSLVGNLYYKINDNLKSPLIEVKIRKRKLDDIKDKELILEPNKTIINANLNEPLIIKYDILEGNIEKYNKPVWYKNNTEYEIQPEAMLINHQSIVLTIPKCTPLNIGEYKCIIKPKEKGLEICKPLSIIVNLEGYKNKILKATEMKIIAVKNEHITLCIESEGFINEKEIKWTKFNEEDKFSIDNDRIKDKFDNNLAMLLIDKVENSDAGIYICEGFDNKELICQAKIELIVRDNNNEDNKSKCHINFEKTTYKCYEGENIIMRAIINCKSSHYSVAWLHENDNLEMTSDIRTDILDNGNITELEIKNCDIERSGHYICRIESKDGHISNAETILEVILPENDMDNSTKQLYKRYSIELMENDPLKLEVDCKLPNKDGLKIIWEKNNTRLTNNEDIKLSNKENKLCLMKSNAFIDDSGLYVCKIINDNEDIQKCEFTVYVDSKSDNKGDGKLKLKADNLNIEATEGKPLIISVELENYDGAKLELIKSSRVIKGPLLIEDRYEDICITKANKDAHSGKMICKAYNNKGEAVSLTFNIQFDKETKGSLNSCTKLLTCTVEEVDLLEGEELNISISTEDNQVTDQLPSPIWFKDGQKLDNQERIKQIIRPTGYNLIIAQVVMQDSGLYSLELDENNYADVTVRVRKNDKIKRKKSSTTEIMDDSGDDTERSNEIFRSSPYVIKHLQNVVLFQEKETAKFELEIENCGTTKSVWYFEGEKIDNDNADFVQWSHDNFFALTIPCALFKHCGKYELKVSNDVGVIKEATYLSIKQQSIPAHVKKDEEITLNNIEESCCIVPKFTKKLKSVELLTGDTLRLSCRLMGEPEPKILWTRNGETLNQKSSQQSRHLKIINDFPNYYLTIVGINKMDAGRYSCVATNLVGYDTTEAILTVDGQEDITTDDDSVEHETLFNKNTTQIIGSLKLEKVKETSDILELSWSSVETNDGTLLSYQIERQRCSKFLDSSSSSSLWRAIVRNLPETAHTHRITLPCVQLPSEYGPYLLRCCAYTELGDQFVPSNTIGIFGHDESVSTDTGASVSTTPQLPGNKPELIFTDVCCARMSWQRGSCSSGRVTYTVWMKNNPKQNDWSILIDELNEPEYKLTLEPGISYMFQITAHNNKGGVSRPSPAVICRVDKLKLVPDLAIDPPWLHMNQGSPCLKWRPAMIPENCVNCEQGMKPEYIVEARASRTSPWKIISPNNEPMTDCQLHLTRDQLETYFEFRIFCHNKYGQNGPTRSYRNPQVSGTNISLPSSRSSSIDIKLNIVQHEMKKKISIDKLDIEEISIIWDKWTDVDGQEYKYMLQRKYLTSDEWEQINPVLFGENCTIDFRVADNYSRTLRLIVLVDDVWHDGYELIKIPSKDELIPSIPIIEQVTINSSKHHEIKWTVSECDLHGLSSLKYTIQYKIDNQMWINLASDLNDNHYTNDRVGLGSSTSYRVSARNIFGTGDYSPEYTVATPHNLIANQPIVKAIRYGVIGQESVEIRWQLTDIIFDSRLPIEDVTFYVEKKGQISSVKDVNQGWQQVSNRVDGSINVAIVPLVYNDEDLYRIQPFYLDEPVYPSKLFRVYITKESLVPDLSTSRIQINPQNIHEIQLSWPELDLSTNFPNDTPVLANKKPASTPLPLKDIMYRLEIAPIPSSSSSSSSSNQYSWETTVDDLEEPTILLHLDDPTVDYVVRVFARNLFGEGTPTRATRIPCQINIPDYSFIRPIIDEKSSPSSRSSSTIRSSLSPRATEVTLSWNPPRMSSTARLSSISSGKTDNYIPYSINVEYRVVDSSYSNMNDSTNEWQLYKERYKRSRIDVTDLLPDKTVQFRLVPVTEYGNGHPSCTVKRYPITKKDNRSSMDSNNTINGISTETTVYARLDDMACLEFTRIKHDPVILGNIEWTFQGKPLEFNQGHLIFLMNNGSPILESSSLGNCILRIGSTAIEHFGIYTATMLQDNQPIITQTINLVKSDPPTFLDRPSSVSVCLHDTIILTARIDGQPPPLVTWRRNFNKIYSTHRTQIQEQAPQTPGGVIVSHLTVSKCISSDIGEYSVKAENSVGSAEVKFNFRVDAQPDTKNVVLHEADINDRYYVMKQISQGSFSVFQKLVEKSSKKEFVGKFFPASNFQIGRMELQCVGDIHHRNLIEIIDSIISPIDGSLVLIYEKIDGPNLIDYLKSLDHWNEDQLKSIIRQVITGLSHLHEHHVCHLDVQPNNVMLIGKKQDSVKLIGFSNARKLDDGVIASAQTQKITQAILTTYNAPELLARDESTVGQASDMWSVGIMTMACLFGSLKCHENQLKLPLEQSSNSNNTNIESCISLSCKQFINDCLQENPKARLQSQKAINHVWLTEKRGSQLSWSFDHMLPIIVKTLTFPEEMLSSLPNHLRNIIQKDAMVDLPRPVVTLTINDDKETISPTPSQISSRASSVSREGINYESLDFPSEPEHQEKSLTIQNSSLFQVYSDNFVSQATKDLLFTTPLYDRSFSFNSHCQAHIVTFECQLIASLGGAPVSVSWYRGARQLLTDSERTQLSVGEQGLLLCTVTNPDEHDDAGVYRCVARSGSKSRAETAARLLLTGPPPPPTQPSIVTVGESNGDISIGGSMNPVVLLTWQPYRDQVDDLIYRVDIQSQSNPGGWQVCGYTVDNRFILNSEHCSLLGNDCFVARIMAKNKYGCSSYSVASGVFNCDLLKSQYTVSSKYRHHSEHHSTSKSCLLPRQQWSMDEYNKRQSNTEFELYDCEDISDAASDSTRISQVGLTSNQISEQFLDENYDATHGFFSTSNVTLLSKKLNGTESSDPIPSRLIRRIITTSHDRSPGAIIELLKRVKVAYFPQIYGTSILNGSIAMKQNENDDEDDDNTHKSSNITNWLIIEEWINGGELLYVLLARGQYTEWTVSTITRQLMCACLFLHTHNLVHGQISPRSILLARKMNHSYQLKLLPSYKTNQKNKCEDEHCTSHYIVFKAPEVRYNDSSCLESDIWSIGVLVYLLLTGTQPTTQDVCSSSDSLEHISSNQGLTTQGVANTLSLPTTSTQFRPPDLAPLHQFSKGATKFVYNALKKNKSDRGSADYWLSTSWFQLESDFVSSLQSHIISSHHLASYLYDPSSSSNKHNTPS